MSSRLRVSQVRSAIFIMRSLLEQRFNIKFCFKLGIPCTKTFEMLQKVYQDHCMSRSQCFEWFKRFKNGQESVEDEAHGIRPSTATDICHVEEVREKVLENGRLTVRELAEQCNISEGSVHTILTEYLDMRRVSAKLVPRLLSVEQKSNRVSISLECLERSNNDPGFLDRIISGDETWVYGYDMETKAQSSVWVEKGSARPKKARQVRSNTKILLTVFFDSQGVVHKEFLPQGQTVNRFYYNDVLRRLRESIRKKRPELWEQNSWFLHHDNAPAHASLQIREFRAKNGMSVLPHPPYSPDLAPADFFLFPKLKSVLKGQRFDTAAEIKENSLKELRAIHPEEFKKSFLQLKRRWLKCIDVGGDYFEGDKSRVPKL